MEVSLYNNMCCDFIIIVFECFSNILKLFLNYLRAKVIWLHFWLKIDYTTFLKCQLNPHCLVYHSALGSWSHATGRNLI